jgi:Caspase domain
VGARALAVILGASEWPLYPAFETVPAFGNSAAFFRDYLHETLRLPRKGVLWLFNDENQPGIVNGKIRNFLRTNAQNGTVQDILVFYVGHGGYLDQNYFLGLRCTNQDDVALTTLPVKAIAKTLYEESPTKRHIIVIDACYASGAVRDFIYQGPSVANEVDDQVQEVDKGCALFCAAGPKTKAKAPWEGEYTMFSGALRRVLRTGDATLSGVLSLKEVAILVERDIRETFRDGGVRPELHVPRQERGEITEVRIFPNPAAQPNHIPHVEIPSGTVDEKGKKAIVPHIAVAFKVDKDGAPERYKYDGAHHYKIVCELGGVPDDVDVATFILHWSFDPRKRKAKRQPDGSFRLKTDTYGNFVLKAEYESGGSESSRIVTRIARDIVEALKEQNYGPALDPRITKAISDISKH